MKTFKEFIEWYNNLDVLPFVEDIEKFVSNRQRRKEGTFIASEMGSNPRRPTPEERGMPALTSRPRRAFSIKIFN